MTYLVNDFLQLMSGGAGGAAAANVTTVTNLDGTVSSIPVITNTATTLGDNAIPVVNYQILPEGFGSYLQGILPDDVATAAGAFSATMQQIKNIRKIDIEKFAQVVTSLETTANLPLVGGTDVPTDTTEAQSALALIALGSGPQGTYTFSDFFGCMSGLPYDWVSLQTAITNMPTSNLATIYSNLYAATQGPVLGLNAAVQAQIDLANAELATILSTYPGQSNELNDMWNTTATQLNREQLARNTGLSPIPSPRTDELFPYPTMIYSFTDLLPNYAKLTSPNLAAQNLEAISDLNMVAGQSIVAAMRSERNQARLLEIGITLDDTIPDSLPITEVSVAYPFNVEPITTPVAPPNSSAAAVLGITPDGLPVPSPDIGIGTLGISQVTIPTGTSKFFEIPIPIGSQGGGPIVPGSLAGSPYTQLIPPALNPVYTSNVLLPASLSVAQAIEQVITCNCDCWVQ